MSARPPLRASAVAAVSAGGALGAVLRAVLSAASPDGPGTFPWTIFAINVAGCALLAGLAEAPVVRRRPLLSPLLGTGVLGGFTTLSAYGEQSRALAAGGHAALAAAYVAGTVVCCLAAVLLVGAVAARGATPGQGRSR